MVILLLKYKPLFFNIIWVALELDVINNFI